MCVFFMIVSNKEHALCVHTEAVLTYVVHKYCHCCM